MTCEFLQFVLYLIYTIYKIHSEVVYLNHSKSNLFEGSKGFYRMINETGGAEATCD